MWDGFNKRKFPRIGVECEVIIEIDGESKSFSTITQNLGLGGMCLVLAQEFKRFQPCALKIMLKDGDSDLICGGRIVWVVPTRELKAKKNHFDTGIEFIEPSSESVQRIQNYLSKKVPENY